MNVRLLRNAAPSTNFLIFARWVPGSGMCHLPADWLQDIQSILEGRDRTWGVAGWEIPAQQQWGCQGCPKSCCSLAAPRRWPAASRHRQWIVCHWLWAPWKSFLFLWIKGKQIIFPCFMWNHLFGCDFASSSRGALPLHAPRTWQWQLNTSGLTLVCSIQHPLCKYYRISSSVLTKEGTAPNRASKPWMK